MRTCGHRRRPVRIQLGAPQRLHDIGPDHVAQRQRQYASRSMSGAQQALHPPRRWANPACSDIIQRRSGCAQPPTIQPVEKRATGLSQLAPAEDRACAASSTMTAHAPMPEANPDHAATPIISLPPHREDRNDRSQPHHICNCSTRAHPSLNGRATGRDRGIAAPASALAEAIGRRPAWP